MKEEIFKSEKLTFEERVKKDLGIKIIAFLFFSLIPLAVNRNAYNLLITILFPLFILSVLILITLNTTKKYIYEVRINSDEIKFYGKKYDKDWNEKFKINDIDIQIIEHKSKVGNVLGYSIIFKSPSRKVTVNKLFNWNNFTLYNLFIEFKKAKGEKIIIDENSLLTGIKKRAEYYYEWEDIKNDG
ncbi:hypothetical protein [Flavobacterium stagni]|uniref:Uncharacterized protein n=1 Tax=Flavobacterium stagni TaxID=2506421 RepID=A0A4Q1K1X3_9FLAO|nr:hypothetical protein [Flavobacterium stagni]RXR18875.1 hypothetical protein EQG61_13535 [Flavobacterium stagni]